jgi:beta-lactamase superfamily II metal-dependent hydrolase
MTKSDDRAALEASKFLPSTGKRSRDQRKKEDLGATYSNATTTEKTKKKRKVEDGIDIPDGMKEPRTKARPNDEKLHLYFIAMGQGDCTVLITPSGHAFMFDIGSSAWDSNTHRQSIVDFLQDNLIFGVNSRLKGLVITHSDEDHNNRAYFLSALSVTAENVYHTNRLSAYNKTPKGGSETASATLLHLNPILTGLSFTSSKQKPPEIPPFSDLYPEGSPEPWIIFPGNYAYAPVQPYQSYLLSTGITGTLVYQSPAPVPTDPPESPFQPYWAEQQGFVIHDEVLNGKRCTVRILVANYRDFADCYDMTMPEKTFNKKLQRTYRKRWEDAYTVMTKDNLQSPRKEGKDANQASTIILIQYSDTSGDTNIDETYLICGDATEKTLNMVMREYPELKNVTILQAPHHGAGTHGSASESFIQKMNPSIAVYSAPYYGERFGHPSNISVTTVQTAMSTQDRTNIESNYIGWRTIKLKGKPSTNRAVYYTQQPYRIYVTGWMEKEVYYYTPPYAVGTNIPEFREKDLIL